MDSTHITSRVDTRVYTGTWVNWSRGRVMGSTLTLTKENGNLLIAFTAFFIAFIASRAWRIISFVLHRIYSTPASQDALHHQRQAILRNSETPGWAFWTLGQAVWAWRRQASSTCSSSLPSRRLITALPALVSSALCIAAFTVSSGFSSQITNAIGDEVLIDGSNCGMVFAGQALVTINISDADVIAARENSIRRSDATNYAQQCYSGLSSSGSETRNAGVFDCDRFAVPSLPTSIDTDAPCPFRGGICQNNNSSNLHLDTGYIDSHKHLGLNAPRGERILFRATNHCAPLRTTGFSTNTIRDGRNFTTYNYGPQLLTSTTGNYTLMAPSVEAQYARTNGTLTPSEGNGFRLSVEVAPVAYGSLDERFSSFRPLEDLQSPDGDLSIIFLLGNGVLFTQPSDDPWYRATALSPGDVLRRVGYNGSLPLYRPEEAASPLGCVERFQLCRGSEQRCGPLTSYNDFAERAAEIFDSTPDELVYETYSNNSHGSRFLWFFGTFDVMTNGGPWKTATHPSSRRLLSEQLSQNGFQFSLRPDQWKHDITGWWSTWLALIQMSFVDVAKGPPDSALSSDHGLLMRPMDETQKKMCHNQKIQSRRHLSFSMFGLCFIYALGTIIFIGSYLLEPAFGFFSKTSTKNLDWVTTETLHLQTLGFQARGRGTWSRFTGSVPVTEPGEVFEPLIFSDSAGATSQVTAAGKPAMSTSMAISSQDGKGSPGSPAVTEVTTEADTISDPRPSSPILPSNTVTDLNPSNPVLPSSTASGPSPTSPILPSRCPPFAPSPPGSPQGRSPSHPTDDSTATGDE